MLMLIEIKGEKVDYNYSVTLSPKFRNHMAILPVLSHVYRLRQI